MSHLSQTSQKTTRSPAWFIIIGIIGPLILLTLKFFPQLDKTAQSATTHFWIVLVPAALAAIIALLILWISIQRQDNRTFLIGLAFILLSTIFALHAISTPGVIWGPEYVHITQWSTPMALFSCSTVLALSTNKRLLHASIMIHRRGFITLLVLFFVAIYIWFMFIFSPNISGLTTTISEVGETIFPFLTWVTVMLYILTAAIYMQQWSATPTRPLAALVSGTILLAQATLAAQYGTLWQLSFWLYHVLLLVAIMIISYSALVGYERTGSLGSIVEGWMLSSTLERQQQGFRKGMQSLLTALDNGDIQTFAASRRELGERFGLAADQLDLLEEAVSLVTKDREQERRLQVLADIGRSTTIEHNPDELITHVLLTLYNTTYAHVTAIGLIEEATITFKAQHRLVDGQATHHTITASTHNLPLGWFQSTDLPYQDVLPDSLHQLSPHPTAPVIQVPLLDGTDLIGVLLYQPPQAESHQISQRMEHVLQSIAAHIASALKNARLYSDLQDEHGQLRQSEHFREQLTQMIVHDLKNPLTAIMSYLEILKRDQLSSAQSEMIHGALRSSRMMLGLVSDLLDTAKLQEGHLELRKEAVSGQALLESSIVDMNAWAKQDRKTIQTYVNNEDWQLCIDMNLIQRVLINLISNAIKHTPSATLIEVGAQPHEDGVRIWVKDNGPGIPEELIPHLFERFRTGANKKTKNSTGLGLFFCKLAVEAHGGSIKVDSNKIEGTVFMINLPSEVLIQPEVAELTNR